MRRSDTFFKDGQECVVRMAAKGDGKALLDVFRTTHAESDWLRTYPEESTADVEKEEAFIASLGEREGEFLAFVNGILVGSAGVSSLGNAEKTRHRAEFGVSVLKAYLGLGIGSSLLSYFTTFAGGAGYVQLELEVVADNAQALALYRKHGFREYGRNPKGFLSRSGRWQELVLMMLDLA